MKGNKGYMLDNGYMGLVNGDYEPFADEKEYDDFMKQSREEHYIPQSYVEHFNALTADLLRSLEQEKKNENIVFSTFSILTLLGIAAGATAGDTRSEILTAVFEGMEIQEAIASLNNLHDQFARSGVLSSANAVCVKTDLYDTIRQEYVDALAHNYRGRVFMTKDMVRDVNQWVSQSTKGMINKVLDESSGNMLACLLNAIAFDADWRFPYEEDDIYDSEFTNVAGVAKECVMLDSGEDWYIESETFKGFIKLYKDKEYCFMALLPKSSSETDLHDSLTGLNLSELYESAEMETVYVTIPEFSYAFEEDLTNILIRKDVHRLFNPQADFSPMTTGKLQVDAILHKAFIEVNRKGTRAAAVTDCVAVAGGCPDFKTVILDRPFIYAIIHQPTALPVFCGIVNDIVEDQ